MIPQQQIESFGATTHDDFLDQMLSSLPSWNDDESSAFGDSSMLVSKHQINDMSLNQNRMLQQQQQLVGDGSPSLFHSSDSGLESSIQGFADTLQNPQFVRYQSQQAQGTGSAGSAPAQPRQRVRARRGQATDPHSIAERLRRERIAERMKGLQELVPNANKTDKASMLDEIIDYVKFLQLQVKVLSMSRLGGASAVVTLVSERGDAISNGTQTNDDKAMTMTEQQVAKLMEEDMGSAMQYLQGKGLCLMPISVVTAISTATTHTLPHNNNYNNANGMFLANENGTTSPTASVLTVQSSALLNDATSGLG